MCEHAHVPEKHGQVYGMHDSAQSVNEMSTSAAAHMANLGVPSLSKRRNRRAGTESSFLSCIWPRLHILRVLKVTTRCVMRSSGIDVLHKKSITERETVRTGVLE